ncbi:MAG: hypothetical protein CMO01_25635 [Thalassobius sp.]|nr:hypothetical protein [Thalassovita sp.]
MGGIVLIAIAGIICGTIVKLRRMQLEKNMGYIGQEDHGRFSKRQFRKQNNAQLEEVNKRLENLETIVAAGDFNGLPEYNSNQELKEQISILSRRISELEQEKYRNDPY